MSAEGKNGGDRERVESLLESLPESAWSIPDPPPLELTEPSTAPARRKRWFFRPVPLALAGAACLLLALVGLGAGLLIGNDDTNDAGRGADRSTVASTRELRPLSQGSPNAGGSARVLDRADGSRAVEVDVRDVSPTGSDHFYEVWLMRKGEFISLGSFQVGESGRGTVELPLPVDPSAYTNFDISLERADGDPAHSTDSVLRGRA